MSLEDSVTRAAYAAIASAVRFMPGDVYRAIVRAWEKEESPIASKVLESMIRTMELSCGRGLPLCQDTGTPHFLVELGDGFPVRSKLYTLLEEAVRRATLKGLLRPNAVDPLTSRNTGDNTGLGLPVVEVELVEGDSLRIHFAAKGGGSEKPSALKIYTPTTPLVEAAWSLVRESLEKYGPLACPPVIVGVGFAGTAAEAVRLSRKALFRPVGERHWNDRIAAMEEELLARVNRLGLGPQGLGGLATALDVKIEYSYRHTAVLAVAVSTMCWSARRATVEVLPTGEATIVSEHLAPSNDACAPRRISLEEALTPITHPSGLVLRV